MLVIPMAVAVALCGSHGTAAANSIKDCDKIQAADAYNLCLASFGPVAHEHDLKPVPAGIGAVGHTASGRNRHHSHRHYAYAGHHHHHGHGAASRHAGRHTRMHLSLTPSQR
jgi:hypothetical protein